jgi:hypothetical protein
MEKIRAKVAEQIIFSGYTIQHLKMCFKILERTEKGLRRKEQTVEGHV